MQMMRWLALPLLLLVGGCDAWPTIVEIEATLLSRCNIIIAIIATGPPLAGQAGFGLIARERALGR
jgi:hypothetical protein